MQSLTEADFVINSNTGSAWQLSWLAFFAILLRDGPASGRCDNHFTIVHRTFGTALATIHSIDCCFQETQVSDLAVLRQSLINIGIK